MTDVLISECEKRMESKNFGLSTKNENFNLTQNLLKNSICIKWKYLCTLNISCHIGYDTFI